MTVPESSFTTTPIVRLRNGVSTTVDDYLAAEEPLEVRLGYTDQTKGRVHKSIAITMRTPGDDKALALGFLFTESIIRSLADIRSIDDSKDNVIRIELHDGVTVDNIRLERHFYTTSSCGVCGKASLETLSLTGFDPIDNDGFQITSHALLTLNASLATQQALFNLTGGNHATALFDSQGNIVRVTEDVGRHNAMDKLIGHQLLNNALPLQGMGILVSGRASFELMQKALAACCPLLAAVGAPSSLAVELAQEFNMTLLGFLGDSGFNLYNGPERVQ